MNFVQIAQEIDTLINRHLKQMVSQARRRPLSELKEALHTITRRLQESQEPEIAAQAVKEAVETLAETTAAGHERRDALIADAILAIQQALPKTLTIEQAPDRFRDVPDESLKLKMAKAGKRAMRGLGKKKWKQTIPVQNLVVFHLLEALPVYKRWIGADTRLRLESIRTLKQRLGQAVTNTEAPQALSAIADEIEAITAAVEQRLQQIEETMCADCEPIIANILTAAAKTGTIEKRSDFYDEERIAERLKKSTAALQAHEDHWREAVRQVASGSTVMLEFMQLNEQLAIAETDLRQALDTLLDALFFTELKAIRSRLTAMRESVRQQAPAALIDTLTADLMPQFRANLIKPLQQSDSQKKLAGRVGEITSQLMQQIGSASETAALILEASIRDEQMVVRSQEVQWRQLVQRITKEHVVGALQKQEEAMEQLMKQERIDLQEVEGVMGATARTVRELLDADQPEEDPQTLLGDALQRIEARLESSSNEIHAFRDQLMTAYREGATRVRTTLAELLLEPNTQKLHLLDAKYRVNEKKFDFSTKLLQQRDSIETRGAVLARFMGQKFRHTVQRGRVLLGFESQEVGIEKKADIAAYLSKTGTRVMELPYIYRRLFDFQTVPDPEYVVGWKKHENQLLETFTHWQDGFSAAMAVKGEKGSGKSTYFTLASRTLGKASRIEHIRLEQTLLKWEALRALFSERFENDNAQSVEEWAQLLRENHSGSVIMIEEIQNLYLRSINGYEALEQLIYLVAETASDIFWVVSCSEYAWSFMCRAFDIDEYFSHLAKTDQLDAAELRNVVLNRHRASGYELVFVPSEGEKESRTYKKLKNDEEKQQEYLETTYFSRLAELAEGNASIGIIFWLRSIQKFDDTHAYIDPLEVTTLSMIEELEPDTLFALAALVLHDSLLAEELAVVLNTSTHASRIMLRRLKRKGIAVESPYGFSLNHLIFRQVINELKKRNILHLTKS